MASEVVTTLKAKNEVSAGTKKAEDQLNKYAQTAENAAAKAARAFEGFSAKFLTVGGLTTAALGYLGSTQAVVMANTSKLAERLGVGVESFQAYAYAAKKAGIEGDAASEMMAKFIARIGLAKAGNLEAAQGFNALGLSVDKLAAMSPDKAFRVVLDALHNLPDQSTQAAMAMKVLGEQGLRAMGLIQQGSAGLDAAAAKLKAYGVSFSTLDAKTVRDAQASLSDLKLASEGLAQSMTVAVAPIVAEVAKGITSLTTTFNELTGGQQRQIVGMMAMAGAFATGMAVVGKAVGIMNAFTAAQKAATLAQAIGLALSGPKGIAQLAVGATAAAGAMYVVNKAFADSDKAAHRASLGLDNAAKGQGAYARAATLSTAAIQAQTKALEDRKKVEEEILGIANRTNTPVAAFQAAAAKDWDLWRQLPQADQDRHTRDLQEKHLGIEKTGGEQFADRVTVMNDALKAGAIYVEQYDAAMTKAKSAFAGENIQTPMEKLSDSLRKQAEYLKAGAISWEQYARRRKAAMDEAFGEVEKTPGQRFAEGAANIRSAGGGADRMAQLIKNLFGEDVLTPAEKFVKTLKDMSAAFGEMSPEQQARRSKQMREAAIGADLLSPAEEAARQRAELAKVYEAQKGKPGAMTEDQYKLRGMQIDKSLADKMGITSLYESTRTPVERLKAEMDRLQSMRDKGLISGDLYKRGVRQAEQANLPEVRIERSAEEVYNRIAGAAMQGRPEERTAKATEEALAVAKGQKTSLDQLLGAVKDFAAKNPEWSGAFGSN